MEFKNDYVLGFITCEIFTVIALQDWVGWGIFAVIPGYPRRANGDSQHLEARPELQGWLRFELFTVKITGQGPVRNNEVIISNSTVARDMGRHLRSAASGPAQCQWSLFILGRQAAAHMPVSQQTPATGFFGREAAQYLPKGCSRKMPPSFSSF